MREALVSAGPAVAGCSSPTHPRDVSRRNVAVSSWLNRRGVSRQQGHEIIATDDHSVDRGVTVRRTEVLDRHDPLGGNRLVKYEVSLGSSVVLSLLLASLASVSALMAVLLVVMRPVLESVQRASDQAEETGRDLERAAEEMERTALLFQSDLPLTMREVQKASEEFELVGKQLNVVFNSVTRPLREPVVEKALSSVTREAEKSTARFSRRIVRETTSVANNLWSSINQVASQLGLRGLSDEAVEEAKRLVYIGRQQQEARNWIERWRMRTSMRESGRPEEEVASFSSFTGSGEWETLSKSGGSLFNAVEGMEEQNVISRAVEALRENGPVDLFGQDDDPVAEVFTALARAQAAAEEAAVSSNALEKALAKAEESGMLSSSDEDDYGIAFDEHEDVEI
jgi:hypothetical protein